MDDTIASKTEIRRVAKLLQANQLIISPNRSYESFNVLQYKKCSFGANLDDAFIYTKQSKVKKIIAENTKFEMKNMPEDGWTVSLNPEECGCILWRKNGTCAHVLAVKIKRNEAFTNFKPVKNVLKNRHHSISNYQARKKAANVIFNLGRPKTQSKALVVDNHERKKQRCSNCGKIGHNVRRCDVKKGYIQTASQSDVADYNSCDSFTSSSGSSFKYFSVSKEHSAFGGNIA